MVMSQDVMNTISLISAFWPDLSFTKEDFVQGKIDFIIRFYSYFVAELNDKISYIMNEDVNIEEFDDITLDFDSKVVLFYRVKRIYKKVKTLSFNLGDFYIPNPKKMYTLIKFSIHFVIFLNNDVDVISAKINEHVKKMIDRENYKTLKQQILQENADIAENLARMEFAYDTSKAKLEELKQLDINMMEDKIREDKICLEQELERDDLQKEVDNLEYELQLLEDRENDLKGNVITEKDYELFKNTEKYLQVEEEECKNFEMVEGIDQYSEYVKILEEHTKTLSSQSFDSLGITVLEGLKHQNESTVNLINKLNEELVSLNNVVSQNEKEIENFKHVFDKTKLCAYEIKNKFTIEEQNEDICYRNKSNTCKRNFEDGQRLESKIITMKEKIRKIEEDADTLNAFTAQEYKRVLQKASCLNTKLSKLLSNLSEQLSHGDSNKSV